MRGNDVQTRQGGPLCAARQSADKAHNRKNCSDEKEIGSNFCFLRQLHLHPAVTYVHVSSLGCKYSFLGLQAFSTLCQSVDFVNILAGRCARPVFFFCVADKIY